MDDRRNPVPPLRADALGDQHERRILLALEYLLCPFGKHDRRERPKCLPVLNPLVQDILHSGLSRVCKQAAIAERSRSELGAALKPADHTLLGKQLRRLAADILAANADSLNANKKFRHGAVNVLIGIVPAEVGVVHDKGLALLQNLVKAVI